MTIETIRERFRAIGLGATLPEAGKPWTCLGDHVHWLDLIGIGDKGFSLASSDPGVAKTLLELAGCGVFPRGSGTWMHLGFPFEGEDPLPRIVRAVSSRGREGEAEEMLVACLAKIAHRTPSVVPLLLETVRADMRHRIDQRSRSSRPRLSGCSSMCSILIEFGDLSDLAMLCECLDRFTDSGQVQFVCDVHARGWQDESCYLKALEALEDCSVHSLHEGLVHVHEGGDVSDLVDWVGHKSWRMRVVVLRGLHRVIPQGRTTEGLFELLLSRVGQEDDSDCAIALGWVLGQMVERLGQPAALKLVQAVATSFDTDHVSCHAALRALLRFQPRDGERDALLQLLDPMLVTDEGEVLRSLGQVRLHLSGVPLMPLDLLTRLSDNRGWLSDLTEPGRTWDGLLGDLLEKRLDPAIMLWLCLDSESVVPLWLCSHWLRKLMVREPSTRLVVEQATRPSDNGRGRSAAGQALLLHAGAIEPDSLYLACLIDDLPVTEPEDNLRTAIHLLQFLLDRGLEDRARKLLSTGGPICKEVARQWYSSSIINDFDAERNSAACEQLVALGVAAPPRPLGATDPHSHVLARYQWSSVGNDQLLIGDITRLEPHQIAMRLETLLDRSMLIPVGRRLSEGWKFNPDAALAAWEVLNERHDWEGREAAMLLAQGADSSFLQGRVGEKRLKRIKELCEDKDADVSKAAKRACAALGIEVEE